MKACGWSRHVLAREVGLSNFHRATDGGKEDSGATCIAITKGLVAGIESRVSDVEVTDKKTYTIGPGWPQGSRGTNLPAKFLQGTLGLVVHIDDRTAAIKLPNPDKLVSS